MRDVIQHIIASETEAGQIVATARAEADCILAAAQQQAQALRDRASDEVRTEVERLLAEFAQRAAAEQQARVAQAVTEIAAQVRLDPEMRQSAVAEVVRCVTSPSQTLQESS